MASVVLAPTLDLSLEPEKGAAETSAPVVSPAAMTMADNQPSPINAARPDDPVESSAISAEPAATPDQPRTKLVLIKIPLHARKGDKLVLQTQAGLCVLSNLDGLIGGTDYVRVLVPLPDEFPAEGSLTVAFTLVERDGKLSPPRLGSSWAARASSLLKGMFLTNADAVIAGGQTFAITAAPYDKEIVQQEAQAAGRFHPYHVAKGAAAGVVAPVKSSSASARGLEPEISEA